MLSSFFLLTSQDLISNIVLHLFRLHVAPDLDVLPVDVGTDFDLIQRRNFLWRHCGWRVLALSFLVSDFPSSVMKLLSLKIPWAICSCSKSRFTSSCSNRKIRASSALSSVAFCIFAECSAVVRALLTSVSSTMSLRSNHVSRSASEHVGQRCPQINHTLGHQIRHDHLHPLFLVLMVHDCDPF